MDNWMLIKPVRQLLKHFQFSDISSTSNSPLGVPTLSLALVVRWKLKSSHHTGEKRLADPSEVKKRGKLTCVRWEDDFSSGNF